MPTLLERQVQLVCTIAERNEHCRRAVCLRYGYCVPPRAPEGRHLFRCRFDPDDIWPRRHAVARMLAERLMKEAEAAYAARGVPSPFAQEPAPDHLDLTRPFNAAALLAAEKEAYAEMKAAARNSY